MHFPALKQTLEPLICTGSAYERGQLQGEAYAKQLTLCFNAFFHSDAFDLLHTRWFPQRWARLRLGHQSRYRWGKTLKKQAPETWDFLQGLAAGSQARPEDLLLYNWSESLLHRAGFQWGAGTTLIVPPRFSPSEEPLMIKNMDFPYFIKSFNLIRQSAPHQGLKSLEATLMPWAGAHTGMNEAGVAISYNYAFGRQAPSARLPMSLLLQAALQNCESAQDVVRFFESQPPAGAANLGVVDTQGEMYLLEIDGPKITSKRLQDHLLLSTNHYQLAPMLPQDIPAKDYYAFQHLLKELTGKRIRESSESRFDRLNKLTGTRIQFHPSDLLEYFSDHGDSQLSDDNSICRHGDYYETSCSLLLRPKSRQLQVAIGNPCETPYRAYQWL